ncbi:MAG: FkbM family methyltransferase [Novosphingobium sp.]
MNLAAWRRRFWQNAIDPDRPLSSLARWPAWLLACAVGRPTVARFSTGGLKMQLVPRLHSFGSTSIFIKRDYYEPELLAVGRLIERGSVVLDIGGSFGIFALFMAHFTGPNGLVHSFEPGSFSHQQILANVALNAVGKRITVHRAAASDRPDRLRLFHVGNAPVTFSVGGGAGIEAEEVPAVRIADALAPEDAARVGFIKIDVEGYEIAALEGARPILEARHPPIMFEVSADALARQGQTPDDVFAYLGAYGYRFWVLEGGRFRSQDAPCEGNIFAAVQDLSAR